MATILENVGALMTAAFGWVGDAIDVIEQEPILILFVVALPLVGIGIGLLQRFFRA